MRTLILPTLLATVAAAGVVCATPTPSQPAPTAAVVHCQVPCGIYGDTMRIDMLMEDADTIEKGMGKITELEREDAAANQLVRWVMTKDEHAQSIQDTVASYWLAQRIKAPGADADGAARDKYHRQLSLLHGITVAAMKCKQTTDAAHVATLRELALEFSATYFSESDLEHIKSHR